MTKSTDSENDVCPLCKGRGWISYTENGYEYSKDCECGLRDKQIMESRLRFANIPKNYKEVDFSNYDLTLYAGIEAEIITKAFKATKWYFDNFEQMKAEGKGLYFYSECKGSGKTRLALSLANELINQKNENVKFATSLDILNEIKSTWNSDAEMNESKLIEHLITTPVLIIDDFGTETTKDWITERFYQIINGRYNDNKVTILTSNYDLKNINYDFRITDRISEKCYKIPFPNKSIRQIKANENQDFMKQFL